jgi:Arc/MetJ-type ribon-helix-helix transcriptional regulator
MMGSGRDVLGGLRALSGSGGGELQELPGSRRNKPFLGKELGPSLRENTPIALLEEYHRSAIGVRLPDPGQPIAATMRESKVTVKIPRPLYRKVQLVVEGSGFNSPTDFIVYVLRDLMGEAEEHTKEFTQDELADVKRKLKNLGYL